MNLFWLFLFLTSFCFGFEYSVTPEVANGQTAVVKVMSDGAEACRQVKYKHNLFPLLHGKNAEQLYAFVPVSYYEKAGEKELFLRCYDTKKHLVTKKLSMRVVYGDYAKESIHVSAKKVAPKSKKVQKRTAREYKEAMRLYHKVTPELYIQKPFVLPLDTKITSDFGKARVYNGSLKGYHGGTDFRAQVGTPIDASNDGKVVLVKNRFYSGGTVIIDHGEGIYTCYFHLSKFLVHEGQMVHKNQLIGLSGKSGRVTGPHLHFGVRVDGVQVDPLQFLHVMNTTILKETQQ